MVIVADDLSDEKAEEEQRRLIALYGRRDLGLGPLWNLTDGGPGIPNVAQRSRKEISEAHTGKTIWPETREKLREAIAALRY